MTPQERYDRAVTLALQTLQFSASERIRIRNIIAGMTTSITKRIALYNLQGISKRDLNALIKAVEGYVDGAMNNAHDDETFAQFWQLMAVQTARNDDPDASPNNFPVIPLGTIGTLLIQGATIAAWRLRARQSMKFRITAAIRQGVANGETAREVIARIVGTQGLRNVQIVRPGDAVLPTAAGVPSAFSAGVIPRIVRDNDALIYTTLQSVLMDAKLSAYRRNRAKLRGIQQISILDGNTTKICIAYSNATWTVDLKPLAPNKLPFNGGVPRHFGCRSTIVEIAKGNKSVQTQSFAEWLRTQPGEFQTSILGPGRAQMWRDGKITLAQLVSGDGAPLTLPELRALYP